MKRLMLLTLLALTVSAASAITVQQLFDKYKEVEDAQYNLIGKEQLIAQIDSVQSESDKRMLTQLDKVETLMMMVDDDQRHQLTADLNNLDGYTLAESFTHIDSDEEPMDGITGILQQALNPTITIKVEIYCRDVEGDYLIQPLMALDIMDFTIICYMDGNVTMDDAKNSIKFSVNKDYDDWELDDDDDDDEDWDMDEGDDDNDAIDMSYFGEMLRNGDYLIAFDGVLRPDIKNQNQAAEYMCEHGIPACQQELIIGRDNVKQFFPDSDAEIVLNFITIPSE